jgi:hypothetical protein
VIALRPHPLLVTYGVIGAPLAWTFQLVVGYSIEEIACGTGTATNDYWGVSSHTLVALVTALALLGALAAFVSSAASWRGARDRRSVLDLRGHIEYAAFVGMVASVFFIALIVVTGAATLALDPCEAG